MSSVRKNLAGLGLSQEELALDVIDAAGPRDHFLGQRHTRRHMRRLGYSELTAETVG